MYSGGNCKCHNNTMTIRSKTQIFLADLEYAIVKHCQIDTQEEKKLVLLKHASHKNKGLGRSLFMFCAMKMAYDRIDICSYLDMTDDEWYMRVGKLDNLYSVGREDFYNQVGTRYEKQDVENPNLFFYRKYLLVSNYLKFQFGVVVE